jgi:hypothetical protein
MATDGKYTVGIPIVSNLVQDDLPEIEENFAYIRRQFLLSCIIPIHNATVSYTYTGDKLTSLTFGGTIEGSASFTYTEDNLTNEAWTVYGKTITITHTYSAGKLVSSSISIS